MQLLTTGYLTKEEELQSLSSHIIPGTLVLETIAPYPGYFGSNLPNDELPESFYIVLNEWLNSRKVFRVMQELQNYADLEFEASPCELIIYSNKYRAIRLRGIKDYSVIQYIQNGLLDMGYKLMKAKKIKANTRIRLEKYFKVSEFNSIGYKDLSDNYMTYLHLPKHFSWTQFKSLTYKIKNNLDTINFDIAYAELMLGKMIDTVRVYSHNISYEDLMNIKKKYEQFIA